MTKGIIDSEDFGIFFRGLHELNGISELNFHLLELVYGITEIEALCTKKFLALVFSLQDDGNTRFTLEAESFYGKWKKKWDSLVLLALEHDRSDSYSNFADARDFYEIIDEGIKDLLKKVGDDNPVLKVEDVSGSKYLYVKKYYKAKLAIEECCAKHFSDGSEPSEMEIESCLTELRKLNSRFDDNREQASAIIRGQKQNLIVTGGPGTGKTTVVLYILWFLLKNSSEFLDWTIHLAAPSGKASDRMLESLRNGLSGIDEAELSGNKEIADKLRNLESSTIHRLLSVNPATNSFTYNSDHQFSRESIFIIDEASMIDVCLFSSLLEAIPEGAKIFILGDPYQLPSVEAGAVLGEIIQSPKNFVVHLKESKRFRDAPEIGRIAGYIKSLADGRCSDENFEYDFIRFSDFDFEGASAGRNSVSYVTLDDRRKQICSMTENWYKTFDKLSILADNVTPLADGAEVSEEQENCRNELWNLSLERRILCAEKQGECGVRNINAVAATYLRKHCRSEIRSCSEYFPGELLIINRNLRMFRLYNGDTGVVVFDGDVPYLMLKKSVDGRSGEGNSAFIFYKLALLPKDVLEDAFAITIHKSQGSEYERVIVVLPSRIGHPLLNNQIIYTGITRAKQSAVVIADRKSFDAGCRILTERDTGIYI